MSTTTLPRPTEPATTPRQSLAALARADARRFARHPLFLFGAAVVFVPTTVAALVQRQGDPALMEGTVLPAFFLGVFGFVVAHRLTTSLRRTGDLADTAPMGRQRRTLALCLACLVPMSVGIVCLVWIVVFAALWPPVGIPVGAPVAWFGDEPAIDMVAALLASVVVPALGGPLLGVTVARWAPFRGSALLGLVVLVIGVAYADALPAPWFALSPWFNPSDSFVEDGQMRSSWLRDGLSPVWYCAYALSLCGLAVVAALLRENGNRRPLLLIGGGIAAVAAASLLLAVA